MTNFIPIFPLALVVYPGEELNLHIFEPRYKQLIAECFEMKKNFGIPSVINDKMADLGTLVEIKEIVKTEENGEMDIRKEVSRCFVFWKPFTMCPTNYTAVPSSIILIMMTREIVN